MVPQYGFHHVGLGLGFFGELGVDVSAVMVWGLGGDEKMEMVSTS